MPLPGPRLRKFQETDHNALDRESHVPWSSSRDHTVPAPFSTAHFAWGLSIAHDAVQKWYTDGVCYSTEFADSASSQPVTGARSSAMAPTFRLACPAEFAQLRSPHPAPDSIATCSHGFTEHGRDTHPVVDFNTSSEVHYLLTPVGF